jgi:hypothetical protein
VRTRAKTPANLPANLLCCRIQLYEIKAPYLRRGASRWRHSARLIDRTHDTARGPDGPCSVAARSISRLSQR